MIRTSPQSLFQTLQLLQKWALKSIFKKEGKRAAPKQSYLHSKNSWCSRSHNIFLSFESGAKQCSVTLIFKIDERGIYSSFVQATLITDIIPKSAKNMPLIGVKNQPLM